MESIITPAVRQSLTELINISKKDPKAEVECKLLSDKIQTKDVAERLLKTIQTLSIGSNTEDHRLTFSYSDNTRVSVVGPQNVFKICSQNTFREVPLSVEKKQKYFEDSRGLIDVPEGNLRFTLRSETPLRKDWEGNPNDPKAFIRMIHRKSYVTADQLFSIDFSMVKTRPQNSKKTIKETLKLPHKYELEIEFIGKDTTQTTEDIVNEYIRILTVLSQSYYQTAFLLKVSDIQGYLQEFKMTNNVFYNPVTLVRKHLNTDIGSGYTVTTKADGERSGLYVARDRRLLKITGNMQITWTGITASNDSHTGDFLDGEFMYDKQLFCIFDIYRFRNRDVKSLPLMKTDEDTIKNPSSSRLGCAKLFVDDLRSQFTMEATLMPMRVETKLFLAGDGIAMEEAIKTILTTEFEYKTDGLIFTPRASSVAPTEDRKGKTWLKVLKWKPSNQNSIDFLVKISPDETYDSTINSKAKKGMLFVSRSPGDDIIYPRETLNGEYIQPKLPSDLQKIAETNTRIPSVFQPSAPQDPNAYQIVIPINEKGLTIDSEGNRLEDNTIIECSFDVDSRRWTVMRTRYDKTYQYHVLHEPQYGNDIATANSIWTSMHVPVTEEMIKTFVSNPPDVSSEDDIYYRDNLKRCSRTFNDVYDFHNRVKEDLYKDSIKKGDTLLELAVGRGGDLYKWKRVQPSKIVGMDISLANITSPTQGSAVRYLNDRKRHPRDFLPPVLFVQGDMTVYPLMDQEDKYLPILTGREKATTNYLSQFEGLDSFDAISCQFALHYACESEEVFRAFANNLEKYGKGVFFGTCLDGQAVYSLLIGKKTHLFGNEKQLCGDFTKEYEDRESWTEEFGMGIKVYLESFERPELEYLVPFQKVVSILEEVGYELVETKMFEELYSNQTGIALVPEQQIFSFLNRSFIFKKTGKKNTVEVVPETEPVEEVPMPVEEVALPSEEVKTVEVDKPKKRKLKKGGDPEPEPILFFGADESKGEYRNFSNMSAHPIEIDGKKYQTVEHYFQGMKAETFADSETFDKIVLAKTPKAVKALGQKVANFDEKKWDEMKDGIMEMGVRTKFVQHPELRKQLMETGDKLIGEANARDSYWGIGTSIESDKSKVPSKWRGQNKLGKILMNLRSEFTNLE